MVTDGWCIPGPRLSTRSGSGTLAGSGRRTDGSGISHWRMAAAPARRLSSELRSEENV